MLVGTAASVLIAVLAAAERQVVGDSVSIFDQLPLWWLAGAVASQVTSIVALARMHRRLVGVSGVRLTNRSALAVVYASNAISGSVPVAGSELGTAFTFRQYQDCGVKNLTAAWVLTIAGVVSSVTPEPGEKQEWHRLTTPDHDITGLLPVDLRSALED